ncbi:NDUFB5 isoform 7 [Pan troglodytes]|uniref:NDUFB5 isoform 7 n=1 Tax=Pan troglodytes TaxID=9598 RepID=A0A2J8L725_PANTR|nr:NDUFB5 isoform 7 [Pan troglodytes]
MAAMSLLRRVSVTAVAALSGRPLGTRLGFGGFLTRGFPKAAEILHCINWDSSSNFHNSGECIHWSS